MGKGKGKGKGKFSIFALQQQLGRPGTTVVFAVFLLGYLLYLCVMLGIIAQKGWASLRSQITYGSEIYTFEYFFKSYDYSNYDFIPYPDSTTPYLIRSEPVFLVSLVSMVFALTLAHFKARTGGATIDRLSFSRRKVCVVQWLSDLASTLCVWLSHLVVIFLFYAVFTLFAPAGLKYPQNLYMLFASERYLYMLFPVLNPISLIRMLSLALAVSFLPSLISTAFEEHVSAYRIALALLYGGISVGTLYWGYSSSDQIWSLIACLIAAHFSFLIYYSYTLASIDSRRFNKLNS